jgi:aminoglycoside phosphotransferase (APT) family kinase protein
MIVTIDPSRPDEVASALLTHLRERLGVSTLTFAEEPQPVGRGFASFIYGFRLGGMPPPAWAAPLIVRILPSGRDESVLEREAAIQRFVARRGYPALEPLAVETHAGALGLPFTVMPRVAGSTMFERITRNPCATPHLLAAMGRTHAALHSLPVDGCPLPYDAPLVERRLGDWRARLQPLGADDLAAGLGWLEEHASVVSREEAVVCHNDFHPLNILLGEHGRLVVIDWTDAALGDRHHDVARTVALLWFAQVAATGAIERIVLRAARGFMRRRYTSAYARKLPLDAARMIYWEAAHVFNGWLQLIELRQRGSDAPESKLQSVQNIPPETLDQLRRYFWRCAQRL